MGNWAFLNMIDGEASKPNSALFVHTDHHGQMLYRHFKALRIAETLNLKHKPKG